MDYNFNFIPKWTLLFYINGNNDLAPEMYNSFLELTKSTANEKIKIIVQISLASKQLVNLIRPTVKYNVDKSFVNGRYIIENGKINLVEVIDNINMSSPSSFLDFLIWSTNKYPTNKNALFLGGHGYEDIGCMTDLMAESPCIMGYDAIAYTLSVLNNEFKKTIDILMIDTCWSYKRNSKVLDIFDELYGDTNSYILIPNESKEIEGYSYKIIAKIFSLDNNTEQLVYNLNKVLESLFVYNINKRIKDINVSINLESIKLQEKELYGCISTVNPEISQNFKLLLLKRFLKYKQNL